MSLKDLSDESLQYLHRSVSDSLNKHTVLAASERQNLEAIDAELKRREQKPVLRMEAKDAGGLNLYVCAKNGFRLATIHYAECRQHNIDPAALARKISVVEMMWAMLRYSVDERNWMAFMRDEYGVAVQQDASLHFCESYIRAVVEGREPTAEQKAAWGIVE